jgi:hypothetical protein
LLEFRSAFFNSEYFISVASAATKAQRKANLRQAWLMPENKDGVPSIPEVMITDANDQKYYLSPALLHLVI